MSKALRRILNHGNTRGLGAVDARLLPVQCGGGLAETHVCGPETLLLLPGAGSTLSLSLCYHHPHYHLFPLRSSVHTMGLSVLCFLIRSSSCLEAGSDQTGRSSCCRPPQRLQLGDRRTLKRKVLLKKKKQSNLLSIPL